MIVAVRASTGSKTCGGLIAHSVQLRLTRAANSLGCAIVLTPTIGTLPLNNNPKSKSVVEDAQMMFPRLLVVRKMSVDQMWFRPKREVSDVLNELSAQKLHMLIGRWQKNLHGISALPHNRRDHRSRNIRRIQRGARKDLSPLHRRRPRLIRCLVNLNENGCSGVSVDLGIPRDLEDTYNESAARTFAGSSRGR